MHNQSESSRLHQYTTKTHIRERPLHWCIILGSLLFVFHLVVEAVAFVILGAWHLTSRRLQTVLSFSSEVHRRELAFGILLLVIGALGIVMSILGLIAFFTLRLLLLRIFAVFLWLVMIIVSVVGILGIIFASQVDGLVRQSSGTNENTGSYAEQKFMLGMNGGLALFMSLTLLVGIIIVRCLTGDANSNDHSYYRAQ
ncbi:unnamed protein product [Adineta steineri]|uniref:Uncharacterized protein n=1 Tax=Adineta steineri TaxID=433720 RepID=A0A814CX20_9BILA|nr:unnamed protein product [Adineta steineri]